MRTADPLLDLPPLYAPPVGVDVVDAKTSEALVDLDDVAGELEAHPVQPTRARPHSVVPTSWKPWWIQRMVLRAYALGLAVVFVIIAGRQSGKTEVAVQFVLMVALERPGSYSIILAPNYITAQTAIDKINERAKEIPGLIWKEQKKRFLLPNGAVIQIFSADRPEKVGRGPTLDGLFWADEAAFLSVKARDATLGALTAVRSPLKCWTSTPKGKNWLFKEFTEPGEEGEKKEVYRFRSSDSPYANLREIAVNRKRMGSEMAAQEFDAVFVDSLLLVFPDPGTMFVDVLKPRPRVRLGNMIGIDVAKHQDWTVFTLLNKWAEGRVIDRFQKSGNEKEAKRFYARLLVRVKAALDLHEAAACIDVGNNSGPGEALADMLEDADYRVIRVRTGSPVKQAKCVERCQVGYQRGEIKLLRNAHSDQAIYELGNYMCLSRSIDGRQVNRYQGPEEEGEWDDCVTSICLAYWGITEVEEVHDATEGDFSAFASAVDPGHVDSVGGSESFGGFGGFDGDAPGNDATFF